MWAVVPLKKLASSKQRLSPLLRPAERERLVLAMVEDVLTALRATPGFAGNLLVALESDQATDYQFFPVFTDLQGVPEESFFHTIMSDVVEELKPAPETLAALRFKPEDDGYDGRDFSRDVQRIIDELKTRSSRQVKLTLLIDEVDVLNEYSGRINQRLRSIFMKTFSEHLVAVMSGVGIRRSWKSEGSPWYNFFDEVEITPLSREDAEALVREPVEGFFRFQPEAVQAILDASSGRPSSCRLCALKRGGDRHGLHPRRIRTAGEKFLSCRTAHRSHDEIIVACLPLHTSHSFIHYSSLR